MSQPITGPVRIIGGGGPTAEQLAAAQAQGDLARRAAALQLAVQWRAPTPEECVEAAKTFEAYLRGG